MYVLLGANGNITSRLARLLLAQNHPVRVVGRDAQRQVAAGDQLRIGVDPRRGGATDRRVGEARADCHAAERTAAGVR